MSGALDGFVSIPKSPSEGLERNMFYYRNEVSPFADFDRLTFDPADQLLVDSYYGHSFDVEIPAGAAVYGRTNCLPEYAGDRLANMGFLRVPFRRMPRRLIRTRAELDVLTAAFISADLKIQVLYRGQVCEHALPRSRETRDALYGDSDAVEPSLLASSVRHDSHLEEILPEWMALISRFLELHGAGERSPLTRQFGYSLFAMALAQHYGLPSVGLDVTHDLDTALFFALTEFRDHPDKPGWTRCTRKAPSGDPAVLYVLAPSEGLQLDYEDFSPLAFPALRPERQRARFMHLGWGLAKNQSARYIFMALYLDPAGDFEPIPRVAELFPGPDEDRFGSYLGEMSRAPLPSRLKEFVSRFRWAEGYGC